MKENSFLSIKTPKKTKSINAIELENASVEKFIRSDVSTENNSNKKIENLSPKKIPKNSKLEAIKTFCRIRPIKGINQLFSISNEDERILSINSANVEKLNVGDNLKLINSYKFSKVFGENSSQEEVFECTCKPLIDDLIINKKSGLVFTYGMTNAGKTFTVIGTPEQPGILPQALKNLLEYNDLQKDEKLDINFFCNFVEIYNEDVFDLLDDDPTGKNKFFKKKLNIKENLNSVFFLQDVTYEKLDSLESFNNILNKGISKKVHSSTNLNQNSSRSHTIFKIVLLEKNKDITKIDYSTEELISLSVVDLAGSERQKRTDAKGKNLQEACKINQSLSTLGKCLEAMKHNSTSTVKKMVPLRESKLTKIFAEYFQGDQNIIMITNINPRTEDFQETIRALNYSCIAKDIKPIKSIIPKLNSGNELKLQLKKEKKMNQAMNKINNTEIKITEENSSNPLLTEKNNNVSEPNKTEQKLNDSLTLNLNEIFDSNLNFEDMNDNVIKTEFTHPPEEADSSTKEEIAKLMSEIQKLREEVNGFKTNNSSGDKNTDLNAQSEAQPTDNIINNTKNDTNPYSGLSSNENENDNSNKNTSNKENNNSLINSEESLNYQDSYSSSNMLMPNNNINGLNGNNSFNPIRMSNCNMLVPYGNYGYPFNPYYGMNMFGSNYLSLPDQNLYNKNQNQLMNSGKGKKNMKNKKLKDILNTAFNNIIPGMQNGFNLIFINSKFGNLCPGQAIQEENSDLSDSDDDNVPKKRKIKQRKKKNTRNKAQKYLGRNKNNAQTNIVKYPKKNKRENDYENNSNDENEYSDESS